ncbi:MAG: Gfo/Idh/MocA family oxidoreductase [Chitinophagaceae bacterium]|nr:Gfo/Idh/MocA family oxidoreductase [Chitinophagaceae bacterium]
MSKIIKWAILGAGKIAHSFVNDFSATTGGQLVGVAAGNKQRAAEFAAKYSLPLWFDYEELYSSNEIDAVYIATTHNFHFEQCKQCLMHGKNVLCEKPITLNDREMKELSAIAHQQKLFLMEAMWTWFLPPVLQVQKWIEEGRIGEVKVIEASFGFPMEKNLAGRLYNIHLAGGALNDLGVYPIALSTLFTNSKPNKIVASSVLAETGVDERTGIILHYKEVTSSLYTSMINIMNNKAFIYGDKGYIEIPEFFKATAALLYDDHHNLVEKYTDDRTTKGYNYEIQHATDCIAAGNIESNIVTHASSIIVQEIMTEVRRQIGLHYPGELQ